MFELFKAHYFLFFHQMAALNFEKCFLDPWP